MPLTDHLGELRRRLTIIIVSVLTAAVVVYFATPTLIEIMIDPIRQAMGEGNSLQVISVLGGFTIRFKVSLFFGVIMCTPIIIWEVLGFFLPALTAKERKWVVPTVIALVVLFFIGMIFCYFVIQQAAFGWLLDQTRDFAGIIADAEDYLNIEMLLEIGFGIAFELPLVVFYLSVLHVVPYSTFRGQWRYIYVGFMILSGVVTPDASPVTMVIMFASLIALYEIALAISRYVLIARDGKASLKWTREEYAAYKEQKEEEEEEA